MICRRFSLGATHFHRDDTRQRRHKAGTARARARAHATGALGLASGGLAYTDRECSAEFGLPRWRPSQTLGDGCHTEMCLMDWTRLGQGPADSDRYGTREHFGPSPLIQNEMDTVRRQTDRQTKEKVRQHSK
ncbi:hypothetical protein J6590_004409 [Homalodisca vitripennis]|nr:hypothetical protein J6590_004409 [Homalodisca vitripennis]